MSSTVRGTPGAIPLDIYTKKIHSVFDMHRVEFGAPENLPLFLKRLREDRHLAMDFWALTAAINTSEGGELPNDQMQDIIVRGVTGKAPAEVRQAGDEEMKQALDDLNRLLSGVDLDSPPMEAEDSWAATQQDTWPPRPKKPVSQEPVTVFSRVKAVPPIEKPAEPVFDEPITDEPPRTEAVGESNPEGHVIDTSSVVKDRVNPDDISPDPKPLRPEDVSPLASPALSKRELDEALARLEMNSRDLKLHLENIDSRIRRIEPHLEELTLNLAPSPGNTPQQFIEARSDERTAEPMDERIVDSDLGQATANRRFDPESNPRLILRTDEDDDPSIRVPLSGYERASRPRAMGLFLALLLVLGGSYFVEHTYGAQLRERYAPGLQLFFHHAYDTVAAKLHSIMGSSNKVAGKGETASIASGDDHGADPMSSTTSPSEESLHAAPAASAVPAAATPEPGDGETAPTPASSGPPQPGPAPEPAKVTPPAQAGTTATPPAALVARSRREPRPERASHQAADTGDFTRASERNNPAEIPVNVPPAVMQENLITSRVPAYPQAARAEGVEGWVVMQAIISKNGTVDQLHVIQGDPLLRAAASEAVSRWHYRPYTVNGRPVDVATIVKVEFKLPRQ